MNNQVIKPDRRKTIVVNDLKNENNQLSFSSKPKYKHSKSNVVGENSKEPILRTEISKENSLLLEYDKVETRNVKWAFMEEVKDTIQIYEDLDDSISQTEDLDFISKYKPNSM